jgi:hypothetical protein
MTDIINYTDFLKPGWIISLFKHTMLSTKNKWYTLGYTKLCLTAGKVLQHKHILVGHISKSHLITYVLFSPFWSDVGRQMLGELHDKVVSDQTDQWLQQQFLRNTNQYLNFELRRFAEHSIDRSHLGQQFQHVQDCNNSHIMITDRKPVRIISLDHIEQ